MGMKTNPKNDLLKFLIAKKIPLQVAIDILRKIKKELNADWKAKEKSILPKYETR